MSASDSGPSSPLKLVGSFVASSAVLGLLMAGLAVPAVGAAGVASEQMSETFQSLPEDLQEGPLPARTTLLFSDGTPMATIYDQNRIEVPLDKMSLQVKQAVLAVEDARFYQHKGVDPQGMFRAVLAPIYGGVGGGASTLTQQWVKNVLLDRAARAGDKKQITALQTKDYTRKVREMRFALAVERKYTKDEILQNYLNIANFSDGAYGVEAASRYYFNKTAADLNLPESALLAGIVQRPGWWNPIKHPKNAELRRNVVMKRMLDVGFITEEEFEEAKKVTIESMLDVQPFEAGCSQAGNAGHFCDYVTKVLIKDEHFVNYLKNAKDTPYQNTGELLYRGGLTVTTTLDSKMQNIAHEEIMNTADPTNSSPDIGAALVSVEPGTGHIKAMAQNLAFEPGKSKDPYKTAINLNTTYEYGNSRGHQPGSNFKPLVLAHWLKSGRSLDDIVTASPKTFQQSQFSCKGVPLRGTDPWTVRTASRSIRGPITVEKATYASINPAYAQMAAETDLCDIRDTAESLGVKLAAPDPAPPRKPGEDPYRLKIVPPMVLGPTEMAPITMAGAYAAFAAEGKYCKPVAIAKITDRYGDEIPAPPVTCSQALEPYVANTMVTAMSKVFTVGTAIRTGPLSNDRQAAGKTGTTNDNKDTWFTGFTPGTATSVWVGHVKAKLDTLDYLTFNGVKMRKVYGGTLAAPTWKKFTERSLEGKPVREFNPPGERPGAPEGENEGDVVPKVWNASVEQAKAALEEAGYSVRMGSKIYSSAKEGNAAGTSPRSGTSLKLGQTVVLYTSKGPKPASAEPTEMPTATPTAVPTATPKPTTPKATRKPTPKPTTKKPTPTKTTQPGQVRPKPTKTKKATPVPPPGARG